MPPDKRTVTRRGAKSAAVCQLAKCVGTSEVGAARRNVQWAVVLHKPSPAPPRQTFWEVELAGNWEKKILNKEQLLLPVSLLRLQEICVGFVPTLSKRQENAQFSVNGAAQYAARVKFIMVTLA